MPDLNQLYDSIKSSGDGVPSVAQRLPQTMVNPKRVAFRNQAVQACDTLKEGCAKRLLLDIYMKILPFDSGYADANRGMCQGDIDKFLADKNMTATQYFQSACKETKAPLLEYVLRSIEDIGKQFMEAAEEKQKEGEEAGVNAPVPEVNEEEIDSAIVDIKNDDEYENFMDTLKRKTVKKIVADISELINDSREDKEMTFAPEDSPAESEGLDDAPIEGDAPPAEGDAEEPVGESAKDNEAKWECSECGTSYTASEWAKMKYDDICSKCVPSAKRKGIIKESSKESAFTVAFDYLMESFARAGINTSGMDNDELMGLAIREATLNEIDTVFQQHGHKLEHFARKIRMGKGILVNEATFKEFSGFENPEKKIEAERLRPEVVHDGDIVRCCSCGKRGIFTEFSWHQLRSGKIYCMSCFHRLPL